MILLYPSHSSLLYFSKGKPNSFKRIRTAIERCRHCGGEIKDYGGHRGAMNPNGVNLTDVWNDITPVRHWKFKSRKRSANQLSTKVLERVVLMTTKEDDIVLDPFCGTGTTMIASLRHQRNSIGVEIDPEYCRMTARYSQRYRRKRCHSELDPADCWKDGAGI